MELLLVLVFLSLPIYVAPAILAWVRGHHQAKAILALNLLLGWTFLGWVAAFVWALTAVDETKIQKYESDLPNVENVIVAQGTYKYRVWAYRKLSEDELRKVVWTALQNGELKQPKKGGTSTLLTRIGQ